MSIKILDGGLGTSLEDQHGIKFDASTPLWSSHLIVENQDTLLVCQRDFAQAGIDVLLTATYQVSIEGFARTRTAEHPEGIPRAAVPAYLGGAMDIAQRAIGGIDAELALSLGAYGACMVPGQEYSGKYDAAHDSEEALFAWHLERLRLFTAVEGLVGRVRYVALETTPRLDEIAAMRRAVCAAGITARLWISCVFPREDEALPDGSSVEEVIEAMLGPSADKTTPWGIGINCTKIHKLAGLIKRFEQALEKMKSEGRIQSGAPALVLYPDGTNGEVYNTTTQKWEMPEDHSGSRDQRTSWASQLADIVRDTQQRGTFESILVGGCCKASAVDIRKLRDELKGPAGGS